MWKPGKSSLVDFLAVQDSGTVVNPQVLKNQVIGGAICGAGFAIYEHLVFDEETGAIKNANLLDYKLLRCADFPIRQRSCSKSRRIPSDRSAPAVPANRRLLPGSVRFLKRSTTPSASGSICR